MRATKLPSGRLANVWSALKLTRKLGRELVAEARPERLRGARPVVAEGQADAALQPPLLRRGEEDPHRHEAVLAHGKHHAGRDLEGLEQALVGRVQVEQAVQRVARVEVPVDQGGVDVPALDQPVVEPREARVEDVVIHLLNAGRRVRARG